jgi:hypothetical protein
MPPTKWLRRHSAASSPLLSHPAVNALRLGFIRRGWRRGSRIIPNGAPICFADSAATAEALRRIAAAA